MLACPLLDNVEHMLDSMFICNIKMSEIQDQNAIEDT